MAGADGRMWMTSGTATGSAPAEEVPTAEAPQQLPEASAAGLECCWPPATSSPPDEADGPANGATSPAALRALSSLVARHPGAPAPCDDGAAACSGVEPGWSGEGQGLGWSSAAAAAAVGGGPATGKGAPQETTSSSPESDGATSQRPRMGRSGWWDRGSGAGWVGVMFAKVSERVGGSGGFIFLVHKN